MKKKRLSRNASDNIAPPSPWRWVPSLYFAEGLPYAVVTAVSPLMFKSLGADNASLAMLTSWLYLPWVIKPLWSPAVEAARSKKGVVVAMQAAMAVAFGVAAWSLALPAWTFAAFVVFLIAAFASATHDIAADGYYMLALSPHEQSRMVGFRATFYRVAMVAAQGGLVMLAGRLESKAGIAGAWQITLGVLAAAMIVMAIYHRASMPAACSEEPAVAGLGGVFKAAVSIYFRRPGLWAGLAFILLFRLPEAQLLRMIGPFLLDDAEAGGLGLSTARAGLAYGTVGVACLLAGGILGGLWASRRGLGRSLVPMAWIMSASCVAFLVLSLLPGVPFWAVMAAVALEQLGYGFGNAAYMLYLLWFSEGEMATSRYAISTGFMALGMMLPGMGAGWLQQLLGYTGFFSWTIVCCIATIALAAYASGRIPAAYGKAA